MHRFNPRGVVVQAGDVVELLATRMHKRFLRFLRNFFQGFQAVTGKAWADQIYFLNTLLG